VSREFLESGEGGEEQIPERRPDAGEPGEAGKEARAAAGKTRGKGKSIPVWRCRVCGYLCARERPPAVCPVCKAGRERFEEFYW
jgi:rubrerythrin